MSAEDEARAQAWRTEQAAIRAGQSAIGARLRVTDAAAASTFRANWQPLGQWLSERHAREPLPCEPEIRGN